MRGLSLVVASGGHSSSRCAGLSLSRPLLLRSTGSNRAGSNRAGSVIVAYGPSWSAACGIFPDQGSNPCPLHWQADSQPLRHQGSPPASPLTVPCIRGPSLLFSCNSSVTSSDSLQVTVSVSPHLFSSWSLSLPEIILSVYLISVCLLH